MLKWTRVLSILFLVVLVPFWTIAEENANYADCDVCHGAIHFSPLEVDAFFEKDRFKQTVNRQELNKTKVVKLDLDGVQVNGSYDTPDDGYEIKIWGKDVIFIKDLRDGSLIQVVRGQANESKSVNQLHIYLETGSEDEINLKDSVDLAWQKMEYTQIYNWVGQTADKEKWKTMLGEKIIYVVKLLQGAK